MERAAWLLLALGCCPLAAHTAAPGEELDAVAVEANEPLYAAPTTRDRIGRVWVPVLLDGQGPFRMVFDTGALYSAVTERTAERLGLPQDQFPPIRVQGATGTAITPTIGVTRLQVGELSLQTNRLPVVPYAFGGADGLLGTDGMTNYRIAIDFRRDRIHIARSRNRRAAPGFSTVRFLPDAHNLLVVRAAVSGKPVRAIIDTGAHSTVGNLALQRLLHKQVERHITGTHEVRGATGAVQMGVGAKVSPIRLGEMMIYDALVTFADLHLFTIWGVGDEPALLIGMDIIGLLDEVVVDYRRNELHIKPRTR